MKICAFVTLIISAILICFGCAPTSPTAPSTNSVYNTNTSTNTTNSAPSQSWHIVFQDDFNRANTTNGNLGDNWFVSNESTSMALISNNQVRGEKGTSGVPVARYAFGVTNQIVRFSLESKTPSFTYLFMSESIRPTNWSYNYVFGGYFKSASWLGLIGSDLVFGGTVSNFTSGDSNTMYSLVLTKYTNFYVLEIKDLASQTNLFTTTYTTNISSSSTFTNMLVISAGIDANTNYSLWDNVKIEAFY